MKKIFRSTLTFLARNIWLAFAINLALFFKLSQRKTESRYIEVCIFLERRSILSRVIEAFKESTVVALTEITWELIGKDQFITMFITQKYISLAHSQGLKITNYNRLTTYSYA